MPSLPSPKAMDMEEGWTVFPFPIADRILTPADLEEWRSLQDMGKAIFKKSECVVGWTRAIASRSWGQGVDDHVIGYLDVTAGESILILVRRGGDAAKKDWSYVCSLQGAGWVPSCVVMPVPPVPRPLGGTDPSAPRSTPPFCLWRSPRDRRIIYLTPHAKSRMAERACPREHVMHILLTGGVQASWSSCREEERFVFVRRHAVVTDVLCNVVLTVLTDFDWMLQRPRNRCNGEVMYARPTEDAEFRNIKR